jgi:hypothetical protein
LKKLPSWSVIRTLKKGLRAEKGRVSSMKQAGAVGRLAGREIHRTKAATNLSDRRLVAVLKRAWNVSTFM